MKKPDSGLSWYCSGSEEVPGAEQYSQPCRQEKLPKGDADFKKHAGEQAHSQIGLLQPVGAGGDLAGAPPLLQAVLRDAPVGLDSCAVIIADGNTQHGAVHLLCCNKIL